MATVKTGACSAPSICRNRNWMVFFPSAPLWVTALYVSSAEPTCSCPASDVSYSACALPLLRRQLPGGSLTEGTLPASLSKQLFPAEDDKSANAMELKIEITLKGSSVCAVTLTVPFLLLTALRHLRPGSLVWGSPPCFGRRTQAGAPQG